MNDQFRIKVSIIIPTIGRPTLKDTLKSVLNQTYPNLEIIVTDDTPEGKAFEIMKKFNSSVIKYVRNERYKKGPAGNKNNGLDHITGDYFTFVDDDDVLLPDAIETSVKIAMLGYQVILGNCVNSLTGAFTGISYDKDREFSYKDFIKGFLDGEYYGFVKTDLLSNDRFYDACWGGEHLLWWKLLKRMKKGIYVNKVFKIYNAQSNDRVTFQMETFPERQVLNYYYTIVEFGEDLLNIAPKQYVRYLLRGMYFAKLANDIEKLKFFKKSIYKIKNLNLKILSFTYYLTVKYLPKNFLMRINFLVYKTIISRIKVWFRK